MDKNNFELMFHQNLDGSFTPYMSAGNSSYGKPEFPRAQEHYFRGRAYGLTMNTVHQMQNPPLSPPIWCSGLITSDSFISEAESVKKAEKKERKTEIVEKNDNEEEVACYTIDEICHFYLLALTDAIRCKLVSIAAGKELLEKNEDAFYGAECQEFLLLYPQKTFDFLVDFMSESKPELFIPRIRDFEEFLWRNQILQKEEGDKNRYRKKVRIGERRPRFWVINQNEFRKKSRR